MHWNIFFQPAPFGDPILWGEQATYLDWLLLGFLITIAVSICAEIVSFFIGSFFGIMKTLPYLSCRIIGSIYVDYFRNIPLIIHLFIFVYIIPDLLPVSTKEWLYSLNPNYFNFYVGFICLGLFMGARTCEQVRIAIESIPKGQLMAGKALGFNLMQIYLYILLPVAYRRIIHPMTSEILNLIKNSAVLSTIGLIELSRQANQLQEFTGLAYESFLAATIGFILINFIVIKIMKKVDFKLTSKLVNRNG